MKNTSETLDLRTALDESYQIYISLHRSDLKIKLMFVTNLDDCSQFFRKNEKSSIVCKCRAYLC